MDGCFVVRSALGMRGRGRRYFERKKWGKVGLEWKWDQRWVVVNVGSALMYAWILLNIGLALKAGSGQVRLES